MLQNWFNRLVAFSGILFVLTLLVLHFFNRFAADDYQLIYERFHYGVVDATVHQYMNWCGRWIPLGFTFVMLSFYKIPGFLFLYGLLTLCFFTLASYRLFWVLANNYMHGKFTAKQILVFALFFILTFFLLTPEKNEVWFWYNATSMYLWNLIFCLFGTSFLIWDRGKTEYILIAGSFAYVGASSEPFAMVVIGVLTAVVVYRAILKVGFSFKYLFALLSALVAFIINIVSQGNEIRSSYLPPASGRVAVVNMVMAVVNMLTLHGVVFLACAAALFVCWVYIGTQAHAHFQPFKKFSFLKLLAGFVLLKLVWVGILFPSAYTLGGIPPQRVQGAIYFATAVFITMAGVYTGLSVGPKKIFELGGIVAILGITAFSGYLLYNRFNIESKYAYAVDARTIYLEKFKEEGREEVIYLAPLPDPGYLHSAEITTDTTRALNEQLKTGMGLNFNVAVKP